MIVWSILICIGTVVAQATLSALLSVNGIVPDLCLVLACTIGFLGHEYKGGMLGLFVGFLQDLLAPGSIGLNAILKGLAGALAGMTTHAVSTVTSSAVFVVTLALSMGSGFVSLLITYPILNGLEALQIIVQALLPQALYNSLVAVGILWLIQKFRQSFGVVHFA